MNQVVETHEIAATEQAERAPQVNVPKQASTADLQERFGAEALDSSFSPEHRALVVSEIAKEISALVRDSVKRQLSSESNTTKVAAFDQKATIDRLAEFGIIVPRLQTREEFAAVLKQLVSTVIEPLQRKVVVLDLAKGEYLHSKTSDDFERNHNFDAYRMDWKPYYTRVGWAVYSALTLIVVSVNAGSRDPVIVPVVGILDVFFTTLVGSIITGPISGAIGRAFEKWSDRKNHRNMQKQYEALIKAGDPEVVEIEQAIKAGAEYLDSTHNKDDAREKAISVLREKLLTEYHALEELRVAVSSEKVRLEEEHASREDAAMRVGVLTSVAVNATPLNITSIDNSSNSLAASDLTVLERQLETYAEGAAPDLTQETPIQLEDSMQRLSELPPEYRAQVACELLPRISALRELCEAVGTS